MKAANGEVVDANGAHAAFDEKLSCVVRDVDEVFVEGIVGPVAPGVAGFEEQAFTGLRLMALELGATDGYGVLNFDDAAGADGGVEGMASIGRPWAMAWRGASMWVPVWTLMASEVRLYGSPGPISAG